MTFDLTQLPEILRDQLRHSGWSELTNIQKAALPHTLAGDDCVLQAPPGTGKTLAYALPIAVAVTAAEADGAGTKRALVLAPVRELAVQAAQTLERLLPGQVATLIGGLDEQPQAEALKGASVVVATPGRLLKLAEQLVWQDFGQLVMDEADRMLDMGFLDEVAAIVQRLPVERQLILCSASYDQRVQRAYGNWLKQPRVIVEQAERPGVGNTAVVLPVRQGQKRELLLALLAEQAQPATLVFARTRYTTERIAKFLLKNKMSAAAIHGNKSQGRRLEILQDFASGQLQVLVATDIAARGLDFQALRLVINYELPHAAEDYLHRLGRAGRGAEQALEAWSLVSPNELEYLQGIEQTLGKPLKQLGREGYMPDQADWPLPLPKPEGDAAVPVRNRYYLRRRIRAR